MLVSKLMIKTIQMNLLKGRTAKGTSLLSALNIW